MREHLLINNTDQYGLVPDLPPVELPINAFTWGFNIDFRNGSVNTSKGYSRWSNYPNTTEIPLHITRYDAVKNYYYVVFDSSKIYSFDGVSGGWTDISPATPLTGPIDAVWNTQAFGHVLAATNGIDPPFYWDQPNAGGVMTDLIWDSKGSSTETWRDKNFRCKSLRSFKGFWVALNITEDTIEYPNRVMWSNPTESQTIPDSFDYTDATNLAGYLDLSDTDGTIIDGIALGDSFLIFKDHSTYVVNYTEGQYVLETNLVSHTDGILAANCAVNVKGKAVYATDGDIVMCNGTSIESICTRQIRETIFKSLGKDTYHRSFAVHNVSSNEVWFCFPQENNEWADFAAVWNYSQGGTWSLRTIPISTSMDHGLVDAPGQAKAWDDETTLTWDSEDNSWGDAGFNLLNADIVGTIPATQVLPYTIDDIGADYAEHLVNTESRLCVFDSTNTLEGYVKRSYIERTDIPIGTDAYQFIVMNVFPRISGTGSIFITCGTHEYEGAPVKWGERKEYVINQDRKVSPRVAGMFFAIRIESESDNAWKLSGLDIEYRKGGRRRRSYR